MATAIFRFHDELAQFLAPARRGRACEYACARAATVKHAIESLGVPHTEAGRLTVNGDPATLARIVREGDSIEVFPHDPGHASHDPVHDFIADAHLGGLARLLRMLGFDTRYDNAFADRDLVELALRERRVILTRDRALLKCREVLRGGFVHARKPEAQLCEVVARFGLEHHAQPFTLCLHCNLRLQALEKSRAATRVPARIAEQYTQFVRCPGCNRIFWQGSHWTRMREMLGAALGIHLPAA
jgi:uncharacterized protein with PIN domain